MIDEINAMLNDAVMDTFSDPDNLLTIKFPSGDEMVSLIETRTEEVETETGSHISRREAFFVLRKDISSLPVSETVLVYRGENYLIRHAEEDEADGVYLHVWKG